MRNRANEDAMGRIGVRQKGIAMGCRSCNHNRKRGSLAVLG
jgi:hypothetical protein